MSARLSLASPAGSLQKSALRKELINQPDFVFTSLRPTNKFVCVVLQKQKDADNIDISLLRFIFAEREGFEPPDPLRSTVFKTAAFDHSAIFPGTKVQPFFGFANFFLKS